MIVGALLIVTDRVSLSDPAAELEGGGHEHTTPDRRVWRQAPTRRVITNAFVLYQYAFLVVFLNNNKILL